MTQLKIVFREVKPDEVKQHLTMLGLSQEGDDIPSCFDPEKLTMIDRKKVGWWDKTHRKCKIGKGAGKLYRVQFLLDKNGKLNLEMGVT